MANKKLIFENHINQIDNEILKRKNKWNLQSISWMDFSDVSQILRIHIFKKWHLYNSSKPLAPWINRIISNQIKNLIRNTYTNYARPCLRCAASDGDEGCSIYVKQCVNCPLYANWIKSKKNAHDTKLPVSIENHLNEVHEIKNEILDLEKTATNIHEKMKKILKPIEWKVYNYLYIEHKNEEQTAKLMGYRTSEKNRVAGYKQIKNIKKNIISKVKVHLYSGDIDIA